MSIRPMSDREALTIALSAMNKVAPIIRAEYEAHHISWGSVECPICKGTIDWTINGRKDHIHAHCRTPHCLTFME